MLQKVRFCDNKGEQIKHLVTFVTDFAISLLRVLYREQEYESYISLKFYIMPKTRE